MNWGPNDGKQKKRDVIARAFGWRDWNHVVEDSQRDGYLEAGGRGSLAASIGMTAAEAESLVEHVERYGPKEDELADTPEPLMIAYRDGWDNAIDAAADAVSKLRKQR